MKWPPAVRLKTVQDQPQSVKLIGGGGKAEVAPPDVNFLGIENLKSRAIIWP
jgi:hypothetical protein